MERFRREKGMAQAALRFVERSQNVLQRLLERPFHTKIVQVSVQGVEQAYRSLLVALDMVSDEL